MNKSIIVHDLGLVEYEKALEYQLNLFNEIIESKLSNRRSNSNIITKNHLVFVEHPHVYTLGKSGEIKNFTGIDSPYEIPKNPNLIVDTENESIEQSMLKVYDAIINKIRYK